MDEITTSSPAFAKPTVSGTGENAEHCVGWLNHQLGRGNNIAANGWRLCVCAYNAARN